MLSFLPKIILPELTKLEPELLQARGIELLMLDFDNTMLPYTSNTPSQELLCWLEKMQQSGIQLCIVSNSKKPRVSQFGKTYGVDVITHARKPASRGIRQCLQRYGIDRTHAALCGDQIYTDVLGANLAGVYAIQVPSILNHNFWLKLRHVAELPFLFFARGRRISYEKS